MSLIIPSAIPRDGRPLAMLSALGRRAVASWRTLRNERVLAALSADTLKDIGYPVANDARNTPTR